MYYPKAHVLVLHESPTRPVAATDTHRGQSCPVCGHETAEEAGAVDAVTDIIRAVLNRVPAARCHAREYDSSGLAPVPCGCRHEFHSA